MYVYYIISSNIIGIFDLCIYIYIYIYVGEAEAATLVAAAGDSIQASRGNILY